MRFPTLSLNLCRLALVSLAVISAALPALSQLSGSKDYGLGGSSVMWYPRAGGLYLNPGEISRLHQTEFMISTSKFSNLASMSAVHFEPFIGTFAAGISNVQGFDQFSAGYARLWYRQHTIGGSVNVMPDSPTKVSLSLGSSAHFSDSSSQNSGFHVGVSVINLLADLKSDLFSATAGVAYWVRPEYVRVQAAFLQQVKPHYLLGIDVRPFSWVTLQVGTQSFQRVSGGLSFPLPYLTAEISGGANGVALSFNFRISDPGANQRDRYFDMGMKAFQEERYSDAKQHFLTSLQYDEYFSQARTLADQTSEALEANTLKYLVEARTLEGKGNYAEASKKYGQVVRMDPNNSDARTQMTEMQTRVQTQVKQLMNTGDSLMDKKNYERAQRLYEQALESDPDSELLILRLQDVAVLLKQTTQSSLARAKSLLDRSQLDEAQREYERILSSDARNTQARTGLETIKTRRVTDQVEQGKTAFNEAKYFEALTIFSEILQRDDKNREAKTMFDKTREALLPEVDKFFKAGLQFYVKENYKSAIESWDKALLIQPQHQATLEYYKRAQEKLKAIEKLEKEN